MDNNILKIIFRVVAVLLSLGALFFQLINFVFGTMVKNVSDMQDDYWYYGTELIPHLFIYDYYNLPYLEYYKPDNNNNRK